MESQKIVPVLRRRRVKAIDLSADWLRDARDYTTWYKSRHTDAEGLADAVYGLPELHRKAIAGASLAASPGCYAAGAILAVAPLLKQGLARVDGIVIDGKSGVTGAGAQGRNVDPMYLYTEANEIFKRTPWPRTGAPRRSSRSCRRWPARPVRVTFTPHLVPLNRGLFTTAVVPLATPMTTAELLAGYREFYGGEPFVRVLDEGERPATRAVVGSNFCDVTVVAAPHGRAVCLSALDNGEEAAPPAAFTPSTSCAGGASERVSKRLPVYP